MGDETSENLVAAANPESISLSVGLKTTDWRGALSAERTNEGKEAFEKIFGGQGASTQAVFRNSSNFDFLTTDKTPRGRMNAIYQRPLNELPLHARFESKTV